MSSHCVNYEVGRDLFAFHSANAGDVRNSIRIRRASQQSHNGDAPTDGKHSFADTRDPVLDYGATTRDRYEPFIAPSRGAIGDGRGHSHKHVERYAPGTDQRFFHVRQMGIEQMAYGRMQVVWLPKLSDSSSFPCVPRFLWRGRKWLAIVFQNRNGMALASQHHRPREPDDTTA